MDTMTIGQAAQRSGVPPKTIRYYESVGLVRPAARAENNYRGYGDKEVDTLRFIHRARGLGVLAQRNRGAARPLSRSPPPER